MIFPLVLTLILPMQAPVVSDSPGDQGIDPPQAATPHLPGRTGDGAPRLPLLREGSYLTGVRGRIAYDEGLGSWTFTTEDNSKEDPSRRFGLLPSMVTQDMLQAVARENGRLLFEMTGRILVYDGMNFILPSFASPFTPSDEAGSVEAGQAAAEPSEAPRNSLDSEDDDVAGRLEERLQQRIGALPRSSDSGADLSQVRTLREGTRLQNRRGAIVRDQRSGTWRFVFDATGSGVVDPTMELLPCLTLERLQRLAAVSDLPAAVLLSGEVTSFHGRNYLLPTIWRTAGRTRNIVP